MIQRLMIELMSANNVYQIKKAISNYSEENPVLIGKEKKIFDLIRGSSEWISDASINNFKDDIYFWYDNIKEEKRC